jgi:hypothetical protein
MSKPHDEPEPSTYHQLQRNRDGLPEPGEEKPGGEVASLPPQPPTSPWSGDPCGDEPLVDRSEDSDVMGTPIDLLP